MKKIFLTAFIVIFCIASLTACHSSHTYQGYVEGKYVYLSSPIAGRLLVVGVKKGESVKKGQLAFALEQQPEFAELQSALAHVNAAAANLANLKLGKRPSELASIEEQIAQAHADLELSKVTLARYKILEKQNLVDVQTVDDYIAQVKANRAKVGQLSENLTTAKLAARINEVKEAAAQLDEATADLEKARWAVSQKTVYIPQDSIVYDKFYRVGDEVPAYYAVLSLLLPAKSVIVFYVNEKDLASIQLNHFVSIHCDGDSKSYQAKVTYVSDAAEYTPPVIYSRSARSKLIYRIEAKFTGENKLPLHPGEPVDVMINP